jgi:hypothetical protein
VFEVEGNATKLKNEEINCSRIGIDNNVEYAWKRRMGSEGKGL